MSVEADQSGGAYEGALKSDLNLRDQRHIWTICGLKRVDFKLHCLSTGFDCVLHILRADKIRLHLICNFMCRLSPRLS